MLVCKNFGENYLKNRKGKTELAHINRELRRLKAQIARLEERKSKLIAAVPER
jgi:cell shape-determining protein MreC